MDKFNRAQAKTKKDKPVSHRFDHLPLLPSGPGGVRQELVVPTCGAKIYDIGSKAKGIIKGRKNFWTRTVSERCSSSSYLAALFFVHWPKAGSEDSSNDNPDIMRKLRRRQEGKRRSKNPLIGRSAEILPQEPVRPLFCSYSRTIFFSAFYPGRPFLQPAFPGLPACVWAH